MAIVGMCAALLQEIDDEENAAIDGACLTIGKVAKIFLTQASLKSLVSRTNEYYRDRKKKSPGWANPPDDPKYPKLRGVTFADMALQFFGGTPGDEARLKTIADAVKSVPAFCAWLNAEFKLKPKFKPTRAKQLGYFRVLSRKYFMRDFPQHFKAGPHDPDDWKHRLHNVCTGFDKPSFVENFAECICKYHACEKRTGGIEEFIAYVKKIWADEEAAEKAREAAEEEAASQIAPTGEANAAVGPAAGDAAPRAIDQEAAEQNPPVSVDQEAAAQQHAAPEAAAPLTGDGTAAVAPAGTEAPASDGAVAIKVVATTQRRPARTSNFAAPSHLIIALTSTPSMRRLLDGVGASPSPLELASTTASSPRNEFVSTRLTG